jgi:hypothetical protein
VAHAGNGGGGTLVFNWFIFFIIAWNGTNLPRVPAITLAARCHLDMPAWALAAGPCRPRVVFFGKYFQRWSLLTFHWCRWSLLSKIRHSEPFGRKP